MKKWLKKLKSLFSVLAISFVLIVVWKTWDAIVDTVARADFVWLIYSVLMWMAVHLIIPVYTQKIFQSLSVSIDYLHAFRIHAKRLPARYIPGGIWHSVARVEGYHGQGIGKRYIALYLLIENLTAAGGSLFLGGSIILMSMPQIPTLLNELLPWITMAALILMVGMLLIINSRLLPAGESLIMTQYLLGIILLCLFWLFAGLAFFCFVRSLLGMDFILNVLQTIGVYLFSWGMGFVTLVVPQGIGVSEFVASQLIPNEKDILVMISLLIGFRVVCLVGDILIWILSFLPLSGNLTRG